MHYFIGNLGHLFIILSFVTAVVSVISYWQGQKNPDRWIRFANVSFIIHGVAVFGIVFALYSIIHNHYFEYHYAWSHSSVLLPWYYEISSFWEGQEGSFLLWIFWNVLIGFVIIWTNRDWRPSVMAVVSITQLFLVSMILGVVVFGWKMGSSPFMFLRDVLDAPIFQTNPNFVPEDGTGLNPLLQNYWMVVHPPMLFLGFSLTMVPFAYAIAGMTRGKLKEWIRPALPWALFATVILGVAILMGAYWAYETLNFGGYWNWDPVENAVYVPWLVMVAAVHTMIAYKNNVSALKISILLVVTTFILILYSTFLTRSGVLGESSVHSFTDLGLSGQLLIYLGAFTIGSIWLMALVWKKIPSDGKDISPYTREFWIFLGAATLCLMAFQVIYVTSYPVYNRISEFFGGALNLAPPADQVAYYSKFQLFFAVVLAILSGTGQFFWWKKISPKELRNRLLTPLTISLLISVAIFLSWGISQWQYILLLTASIYSITSNAFIFGSLAKTNIRLSGGAVAHIGIAMMLIGILFSSGYSKILSMNYTGRAWNNDFPEDVNQNNLLLFQNDPRQMGEYTMVYRGIRKLTKEAGYVDVNELELTDFPNRVLVKRTLSDELSQGDTLTLTNFENSYFEVEYSSKNGEQFTLYPRVQINDQMDMIVYSPDILHNLDADVYTHVRTFPDPEQEPVWSAMDSVSVVKGESFFINDYVAHFRNLETLEEINGIVLNQGDVAVKANIEIEGEYRNYMAEPIYVIQGMNAGMMTDQVDDLASQITILSIRPESNEFVFGISTTQKEWIIMEAVQKPFINILWIGTLLLVIGLIIATSRRYREFRLMRDKAME
ncbi:MAG: cytochrome c biogenesis protein CcsA [Cytophagales bacterium]|nr:cytochrome c biogenesis protein CcsA [Cytophagales bacterium]